MYRIKSRYEEHMRNNAALLRLSRRGNLKTFSGGRTIVQELNYADNQTYQWYSGLSV